MKRLIYFILGLLVASCYDDKGNYTYQELKVLNFSVEWYNLEYTPLIQLHFLTNRSPPLISQPVPKCRLTASPQGKPSGANL